MYYSKTLSIKLLRVAFEKISYLVQSWTHCPHIPFSAAHSPPNSNVNLITVQRRKRASEASERSQRKEEFRLSKDVIQDRYCCNGLCRRRRSFFAGMSWVSQRVPEEIARVRDLRLCTEHLGPPGGASATMGGRANKTNTCSAQSDPRLLPSRSERARWRSSSRLSRTYHQRME